ncbi:MAG: F0F1 ATP synthase subunit gamma [Cyanobacteria bacterium J06639_1]
MNSPEALRRKIDSARDLQSVVKTMKALAAASIRQYELSVASLARYDRTLTLALQAVLQRSPPDWSQFVVPAVRRTGWVVLGSDRGMCGQFNERIGQFAVERLEADGISADRVLIACVGDRAGATLERAGWSVASRLVVPSSIAGVVPVVQAIVLTLEEWRTSHQVDRISVVHARPLGSSTYQPTCQQLFPLDVDHLKALRATPWPGRSLPTYASEGDRLLSALIRQVFFVSLYRACAESLASENASRLMSMQVAEKNVAERLAQYEFEFQQQRQTSITSELLDIVAGFEALTQA